MADPENDPESEETADAEGEDEAADGPSEARIGVVFLDPEITDEVRSELEASLGTAIRVAEPLDLDPDLPGDDDGAIVVPWTLGSQCGLDLVEALRRRETEREITIVMASETPTRHKVSAALRAGASSFAHRPYDAEELLERLAGALSAEPTPEAAESEESDPHVSD